MKAFQTCGPSSHTARAILLIEGLLTSVRGDGAEGEEEPEITYALIGAGIGLFLSVLFIIAKYCIIRRQVVDDDSVSSLKRPSTLSLRTLRTGQS